MRCDHRRRRRSVSTSARTSTRAARRRARPGLASGAAPRLQATTSTSPAYATAGRRRGRAPSSSSRRAREQRPPHSHSAVDTGASLGGLLAHGATRSKIVDGRCVFAHHGPSEPDPRRPRASAAYHAGMAELGYCVGELSTASAIVDAWMNSPPNRCEQSSPRASKASADVHRANAPTAGDRLARRTHELRHRTAPTGAPPPVARARSRTITGVRLRPGSFRSAASDPRLPLRPGARCVSYTLTRPANVRLSPSRSSSSGRRACKRFDSRRGRPQTAARGLLRHPPLRYLPQQGPAGSNVVASSAGGRRRCRPAPVARLRSHARLRCALTSPAMPPSPSEELSGSSGGRAEAAGARRPPPSPPPPRPPAGLGASQP